MIKLIQSESGCLHRSANVAKRRSLRGEKLVPQSSSEFTMANEEDPEDVIKRICDDQQRAYLKRSSVHFLECAVHLCVTHMSIEEAAILLDQQAALLREHS
jgi:hypothetical protein